MVVQNNRLEDYEAQIQTLLDEIRKYKATGQTLRDMALSLEKIQKINLEAGRSLNLASANVAQTLSAINSLNLDEMSVRTATQYANHQESLDLLATEIRDAVREHQRLGLEVMQASSASQKQFDAFLSQFTATTAGLETKLGSTYETAESLKGELTRHAFETEAGLQQLIAHAAKTRWILLGLAVVVIVLNGLILLR